MDLSKMTLQGLLLIHSIFTHDKAKLKTCRSLLFQISIHAVDNIVGQEAIEKYVSLVSSHEELIELCIGELKRIASVELSDRVPDHKLVFFRTLRVLLEFFRSNSMWTGMKSVTAPRVKVKFSGSFDKILDMSSGMRVKELQILIENELGSRVKMFVGGMDLTASKCVLSETKIADGFSVMVAKIGVPLRERDHDMLGPSLKVHLEDTVMKDEVESLPVLFCRSPHFDAFFEMMQLHDPLSHQVCLHRCTLVNISSNDIVLTSDLDLPIRHAHQHKHSQRYKRA